MDNNVQNMLKVIACLGLRWRSSKIIFRKHLKIITLKHFYQFEKKKIQDFPADLAYPLGGSQNEFKYFILQIHYNNQNLLRGKFHERS